MPKAFPGHRVLPTAQAELWHPAGSHACLAQPGHGRHCRGAWARGCRAPVCPGRQIRVAQATGTEKARRDGGRWVHKGVCFLY